MAYRGGRGGRGRGRGGFGGGTFEYRDTTAEPFEIFPEITLPNAKSISIDKELIKSYSQFQSFWKNSSYHLGDGVSKQKKEILDIEMYSDSLKPKKKANMTGSFYDFLVLRPDNFPKELLGETRRERPVKRARWTQDADLQKLDLFEKLEAKYKAAGKEDNPEGEDDEEKEKKKEEDDDEDDDDKESEISISSGGDYDQVMLLFSHLNGHMKSSFKLVKNLVLECFLCRMKTLMMMMTILTRRKMLIVNHCIKKKFIHNLLPKSIKFC